MDKWLKGSGGKCPQCNAKAKKGHIRIIYAKAISVVDTTERDQALKARQTLIIKLVIYIYLIGSK